MKEVDVSSLEHTSWRCQYHVVFAPKYRRMEIGSICFTSRSNISSAYRSISTR